MIGLGDRPPASVLLEQRDDVIDILIRRLEVHDQWSLPLHPQGECRDERALEAVCPVSLQREQGRGARLPVRLHVDRNAVEKVLDFPWRGQPLEGLEGWIGRYGRVESCSRRAEVRRPGGAVCRACNRTSSSRARQAPWEASRVFVVENLHQSDRDHSKLLLRTGVGVTRITLICGVHTSGHRRGPMCGRCRGTSRRIGERNRG